MITLIDDADFRKYFPLPVNVDTNRLSSIIRMTQMANVRDLLGDSLYQYALNYAAKNCHCDWADSEHLVPEGAVGYDPIMDIAMELKMLHAMHTAVGIISVYYGNGIESSGDMSIDYITGNIKMLEGNIIKLIQANAKLSEIASLSDINVFDSDAQSYNTIYYDA